MENAVGWRWGRAGSMTASGLGAALGFGLLAAGCVPFGYPRAEEATAAREYRSALQGHEQCEPQVELVRSVAQANRPYREVANLSANCYPGVLSECERRLLQRACELKANAVILTEAKAGGSTPGGTTDSRVVRSGLAVRWTVAASPSASTP